jgi:hypothetical protein
VVAIYLPSRLNFTANRKDGNFDAAAVAASEQMTEIPLSTRTLKHKCQPKAALMKLDNKTLPRRHREYVVYMGGHEPIIRD